ncbi:hypothetical protein L6R50_04120 [Myxococcota bacterium]|nr:hypothetical protein [Myxococcota bacterium]
MHRPVAPNALSLLVAAPLALAAFAVGCTNQGITAYNSPPSAAILHPSDGDQADGVLVFEGQVGDTQDPLDTLTVLWKSSVDGTLWEGNADAEGRVSFSTATLSYGAHAITLQAVDSDAESGTATIGLLYVPAPPRVEILNPATGASFTVGDEVEFRGLVEGADGEGVLDVRWASNVDATIWEGVSDPDGYTVFSKDDLAIGLHTVSLTAFVSGDGWQVQGQALITIQVEDIPEGDRDQDGDGYTPNEGDCDDHNATVHPGGEEICDGYDNDCNGVVDDGFDFDGDGSSYCAGDCDDADPSIHPGALEDCDGIDENCDGVIDDGWDIDGDGWTPCEGDCDDTQASVRPGIFESCDTLDNDCDGQVDEGYDLDGDGFASCGGDCNDGDAEIRPGATEVCDNIDQDCDGLVDEAFDIDSDGVATCEGDCDDAAASVYPGATEVCDARDNDCDGAVDEGHDADFDGYSSCAGDCNDANGSINPGRSETCNTIDDDCDGSVDEGYDADGDGYTSCGGDCDDGSSAVRPGATEVCDGQDNDCDLSVDEGYDADHDGWANCMGDCDDGNASIYPGRAEICDDIDQDCDGEINNGYEGSSEPASEVDWETDWNTSIGDIEGILNLEIFGIGGDCGSAADTCFDESINIGGIPFRVSYCYDVQVVNGRFHSTDDTFDAYFFEYEPLVDILDYAITPCGVRVAVSGIPSGHDYRVRLYHREDSGDAWTQVDYSDNSGSSTENVERTGSFYELDGQYLVVVESKDYYKCSGSSDYAVEIKGA